jgi:large subunit ribosomal protein L32
MSRSNTRSRRANWKAAPIALVACENRACRAKKPPHTACPTCGTYGGRQVVTPA